MRASLIALVLLASACGASDAVVAARRGDAAALQKAMDPALRAGKLGDAEAEPIARAVAEREIAEAKGPDGVNRIREVRSCVMPLGSALSARAQTHDEVGAEAATALLESDAMSTAQARTFVLDTDDGWRAVGVRGLVRESDAEARAKALVDPSTRVRRAAMRASVLARAVDEVPALLEAARVDPDRLARSEAVRAVARLDPAGSDAAVRLRDLWNGGDEALREDIALAYASPHIAASGGAEALRVLLAAGHGAGAVSAATLVLRHGLPTSAAPLFEEETRKTAIAVLLRAINDEPRRERMLALALAPTSEPQLLEAVKKASRDESDIAIRAAALARLLEVPTEKAEAKNVLLGMATPSSPEGARRTARLSLAAAGELSIQSWLEADLKSEDASTKLLAANALASLHRAARAAPLLADHDVHVRVSAACTILGRR